jgi:hypothetical protein
MAEAQLRAHAERYLPGAPFRIEVVDEIPSPAAASGEWSCKSYRVK